MASKRRIRRKSCDGKRQYASQVDAVSALKRIGTQEMHPYRCDFGKHWHIGHPHKQYKRQLNIGRLLGFARAAR